jgi:ACS family sodium-dependent inorganic phosphate cotransporter
VSAASGAGSRRHVVVGLTSLAIVIGYTDRVNISVAAVVMKDQLGWSETEKGLILSSFFVGYMAFMLVGGWCANRFGGMRVLGVSVVAWSLLTLLTPLTANLPLAVLIAARVATGVGEAAMFPAAYELVGRWAPAAERTRAIARVMNGIPVGTVLGLLLTGWLVADYGWGAAFYAFGGVGLLWAGAWFLRVEGDPARDPRLGDAERALLAVPARASLRHEPVPWRGLLLRAPVLAIVATHFATTWNLYVLLSWLPSYFRDVQHVGIAGAGLFSALPWLAMALMTHVGGGLSDRWIAVGLSVTATRKLMQCSGLLGSAACLLAMRALHSPAMAEVLLCGAAAALGLCWCGFPAGILDVAPRHGALVNGFSNTIATIPGIVGVAVVGWLIDLTGTYAAAFALTAAVSVAGALAFALRFDARPLLE